MKDKILEEFDSRYSDIAKNTKEGYILFSFRSFLIQSMAELIDRMLLSEDEVTEFVFDRSVSDSDMQEMGQSELALEFRVANKLAKAIINLQREKIGGLDAKTK